MTELGAYVSIAVGIVALIAALFGAVRWLRNWIIAQVAQPLARANKELQTPTGSTIGESVMHTAAKLDEVDERLQRMGALTQENRDLAIAANILAKQAHERLDEHLVREHGKEQTNAGAIL